MFQCLRGLPFYLAPCNHCPRRKPSNTLNMHLRLTALPDTAKLLITALRIKPELQRTREGWPRAVLCPALAHGALATLIWGGCPAHIELFRASRCHLCLQHWALAL